MIGEGTITSRQHDVGCWWLVCWQKGGIYQRCVAAAYVTRAPWAHVCWKGMAKERVNVERRGKDGSCATLHCNGFSTAGRRSHPQCTAPDRTVLAVLRGLTDSVLNAVKI